MDELSNAFSVLELDMEDDKEHTMIATAADGDGERVKEQGDGTSSKNENEGEQSSELIREEYKSPLVWIDLEMTAMGILSRYFFFAGLNIEVDRILEIACIITDTQINEKKNFISSQMNLYMRVNHQLLGILSCGIIFVISCKAVNSWKNFKSRHKLDKERARDPRSQDAISVQALEKQKYMPNLVGLFSRIIVDVSSIKGLCLHWYLRGNDSAPVPFRQMN
ncbi:oligoribonuclease isoform X1 [Olea europaea subsp. europaea]|uniref:Oligoribonuclease isoform X1 n=1 Tax=Olea europaea subsp. europaea TaxID=158383 RepID=A0A8S0VFL6_OLEEU|nr:oligoribonuclease isoform X1 [Olea europaea subsp. europaea]